MNFPRRIVTYLLRDGSGTSNNYYKTITAFAESSVASVWTALEPAISDYRRHLCDNAGEACDLREQVLELLTLGVLWRAYAAPNAPCTLDGLEAALAALEPTGEFTQESVRLQAWYGYLSACLPSVASQTLARVVTCAAEFEEQAERTLGRYTPNVERFLADEWSDHESREDRALRGRKRTEYYLNMLGTELLNRAFRPAFLAAPRKIVLAPPCMRAKGDDECQAQAIAGGHLRCRACAPGCRVNQLTQLGQKHGFEVSLIPDELRSLAARSVGGGAEPMVGVVGISCVLTNTPGGWEAKALGLPAQGLFLDYCGCSYHWDDEGFPTDTNFDKLLEILRA